MSQPAESTETSANRPRVQSAARAVGILLAVAKSDRGLTPREISERLGIGRQAVYHLLHTLIESGMLARADDNRIVLGLGVGTLARGFDHQLSPSEHLAPLVRDLALATDETSYAAGWWQGEVIVHAVARGTNPVQAAETPRGFTGQAHARASGKLLLALGTDATRAEYFRMHPPTALTSHTIVDPDRLAEEFDLIRKQGFAIEREEFSEGVCCAAMPLDGGHSPFVISISVPKVRFEENIAKYLEIMGKLAADQVIALPA